MRSLWTFHIWVVLWLFTGACLWRTPPWNHTRESSFWATLLSLGKDGANSIWVIGCLGRSRILWELRFTGVGLVAEPKDVQCTRGVQLGGCRKSTNFFEWSSQPRRPAKLCQHHLLDLLAIQYSIPFFGPGWSWHIAKCYMSYIKKNQDRIDKPTSF